MYILTKNANIIIVIWLYFTIIFILITIFPIFINVNIFLDYNQKKVYFAIYLYGFVKILSGYIEIIKEGIVIHLSKNKAIIVPFKNLISLRQKFKYNKGFELKSLYLLFEWGNKDNLLLPVTVLECEKIVTDIIFSVIKTNKKFINFKNNILIIEEETVFKFAGKATVFFNLLVIYILLFKIILEKIFYARNNRKQN